MSGPKLIASLKHRHRLTELYLVTVLSFLICINAKGNDNLILFSDNMQVDTTQIDSVYSFAQEMPQYPGGDAALLAFFFKNIQWPEISDNSVTASTFYLSWVVEKDGSVTNPDVKCPSALPMSKELEQSFINVITKLSDFIPAKMNGKPVRFRLQVPLRIHLQD